MAGGAWLGLNIFGIVIPVGNVPRAFVPSDYISGDGAEIVARRKLVVMASKDGPKHGRPTVTSPKLSVKCRVVMSVNRLKVWEQRVQECAMHELVCHVYFLMHSRGLWAMDPSTTDVVQITIPGLSLLPAWRRCRVMKLDV